MIFLLEQMEDEAKRRGMLASCMEMLTSFKLERAHFSFGGKVWHNKAICASEVVDEEKSREIKSRVSCRSGSGI